MNFWKKSKSNKTELHQQTKSIHERALGWQKSIVGKELPRFLACTLAGLYLTGYVESYIWRSIWLRMLVFGCFFAVCRLSLYVAGRFCQSVPRIRYVLLSMAAAILLLAGCWGIFFPLKKHEVYISLTAETAGEICLCDIVVDGKNIPVSQAEVTENSGWLYRKQYDNFMIWPEEDGVENRLTMRFYAGEIQLGFPYTPYAGSVSINSSAGGGGTWDLRCPEWEEGEAVEYADILFECHYSLTELLLYVPGILLVLGFFFSAFFYAVNQAWRKSQVRAELLLFLKNNHLDDGSTKKGQLKKVVPNGVRRIRRYFQSIFAFLSQYGGRLLFLILLFVVYYSLFFSSPQIAPSRITAVFLAVLTAASYLCLSFGSARRLLDKYRTPGKVVLLVLIALYASLASFGQRFFLDGNTRMHFSSEGLFYIVLGTLWFVPVIYLLLFGLEWLASSFKAGRKPLYRHLAFWVLLAILCFGQAVILWGFWPGGFPGDSISLIQEAVGQGRIFDWHPAINAILYRIILDICPHAGALVAVQLFFFALLCTKFLILGYDYGVSFRTLVIFGVVFSLLPNLVIFGISPLKDYPYTLSLLWVTYLLIRLSLDSEELRRRRFCLALSLALFLVYAFRHNGIVPFVTVLLLFMWITLRHFPKVKLRLLAVSLGSILMIALYKGPVFSWFQVSQDVVMSPYTTMLNAVASCINKNLPLSGESTAIMESILPIDQWGEYYNRYMGHDPYYWGRGELADEYPFDPSKITAKEAFTVYLEALCKYPDVVIKDRLDGMDLLWDVRQPSDSFNTKGFYGTVLSEEEEPVSRYFDFGPMEPGEHYYNHSLLSQMYRSTLDTAADSVFDMLLWRSGAYIILLMTLGLFWWGNRMKRLLWAAVPLLGQLAGMVLVLYHQSYRYISAVQILTLVLVFCSVFLFNARESDAKPTSQECDTSSV